MGKREYSFRQLMETAACTNCQVCADVCPAVMASGDGQLSGIFRLQGLRQILKSRSGFLRRLLRARELTKEEWDRFSETVFRCTLCGKCQEACPVGIHLKDLWVALRSDLVRSGAYPQKIDMIRENLGESRNVFAEDNEERADWVEDMREAPDHGYLKDQAEVVYFTGCVAAYFPLAQKIPMALTEILEAGKVDFTLLGQEEWCCGFPLLGAGLRDLYGEFLRSQPAGRKGETGPPGGLRLPFLLSDVARALRRSGRAPDQPRHRVPAGAAEGRPVAPAEAGNDGHLPRPLRPGPGRPGLPGSRGRPLQSIPGLKLVELPRNRENAGAAAAGGTWR